MPNLIELLRAKHRDDLFVAECNTGSAWSGSSIRRLDAWVMRRSWSPLEFIGYEIKSSRQDFERDLKWAEYIPFCHKFSFVCERGLIQPNDLPLGVGLLWATKDGKRLFVKVPAPRREVNVSSVNKLMTYVLMSRSVIVANMHEANGHKTPNFDRGPARDDLIRRIVEQAEDRKQLAEFVADHVRRRCAEADDKLKAAQIIEKKIAEFDKMLAERGLEWKDKRWMHASNVVRQAEEKAGVIARYGGLLDETTRLAKRLDAFREAFSIHVDGKLEVKTGERGSDERY